MLRSITLLGLAALASPLAAQTVAVSLVPTQDGTLYADPTGSLANGSGQYLFLGQNGTGDVRRVLVAFDVAAVVPAKARILNARIEFTSSRSTATGPVTASVHRVEASWGEGASVGASGEGGGGPAMPGDATWLHRHYPNVLWNTPGGDYAPASVSATIPVLGTFVFPTTTQLIADVQDWLDGRRPNHGWLVRTEETQAGTARRLDSKDNTSPSALQPRLLLVYMPAGNWISVGNGCVGSGGLPFQVSIGGQVAQGANCSLDMRQGLPFGLATTLLSYDILPNPVVLDPGCTFYLRPIDFPTMGFRVLDAAGSWSDSYAVPNDPNLFGAPFALQSVCFDLALPRGFVLSNAIYVCFR